VTSGAIAADPGNTGNLGWTFNSGAQAFSFLNAGETLTLDYTVQATDGSAADVQTVTVTVTGAGAAPVANGDLILVSDLTTVVIPWSALLDNDSDPSASIVSVTSLNGVGLFPIPVTLNAAARTITFTTPIGGDFSGNSFTYTISTASGTSTASVAVSILPINNIFPVSTDLSGQFYDFSYLFTNSGDDVLGAGGATDHFFGGAGNDVYRFRLVGGGDDHIDESILGGAGNDTIQILTAAFSATAFTDLNFQRGDGDAEDLPDDLVITYSGNLLTVNDQFDLFPSYRVEQLAFTNGGTFYGYALGTGPYSIDDITGGNDIAAGSSSGDFLNGGAGGRELMFGNAGNDNLDAGIGDDLLVGGTGNDMLFGGGDDDTYLFFLNDGIDSILENGGIDQIVIATNGAELSSLNFLAAVDSFGGDLVIDYNGQQVTVIDQLSGNGNAHLGSLTFFGGASYLGYDLGSSKYTLAGSGTDMIRAADNGDNFVQGASGRDLIFGNGGNDTIIGVGGTDLLVGGAGSDTITGGSGNDVLVGGTGHDILTGGGGFDQFVFAEAGLADTDVVTDYATIDVVDLSPLLDSQFGPGDNFADFARITQNGSTITVQADLDGAVNGANFVDVASLSGYGTLGQDLVHVHFGNTTFDLVV
jgi:VCBS repeat-containing protein